MTICWQRNRRRDRGHAGLGRRHLQDILREPSRLSRRHPARHPRQPPAKRYQIPHAMAFQPAVKLRRIGPHRSAYIQRERHVSEGGQATDNDFT